MRGRPISAYYSDEKEAFVSSIKTCAQADTLYLYAPCYNFVDTNVFEYHLEFPLKMFISKTKSAVDINSANGKDFTPTHLKRLALSQVLYQIRKFIASHLAGY